jgi:hypothetical protein
MKYIVTKRLCGHDFDIGQAVTVKKYHGGYKAKAVRGETPVACYVSMYELEPLPMSDNKKIIIVTLLFLIACALLDCVSANASGYEPYLKVGVGYKFSETRYFDDYRDGSKFYIEFDDPLAARFEAGWEKGNVTFGVAHYSNWRTGWPFNDRGELQNTQIFVDYKWGGK